MGGRRGAARSPESRSSPNGPRRPLGRRGTPSRGPRPCAGSNGSPRSGSSTGFEEWQKRTRARLTRLEAYAVDSRLERDQIEDTLHAARTGDIAQALSTFQQVDRVVALKERHLDQAREELERVVALLRDMQALGVDPPSDPTTVEEDLESELRAGKLAPLKQQIRTLRLQAVNRLKAGLPRYISEYGDYLLDERAHGVATELEAIELARGAREFFRGHPEEGLRRLRALQQTHGLPPSRAARSTTGRRSRIRSKSRTSSLHSCLWRTPHSLNPRCFNRAETAVRRARPSAQTSVALAWRAHSTPADTSALPIPWRRAIGSTARLTRWQLPRSTSQPMTPTSRPSRRAAK